MVAQFTPEQRQAGNQASRTTKARASKESKLRQLLDAQTLFMADMHDPMLSVSEREQASRAWDRLEERIRILRGHVKPGSRNVSVREIADAQGNRKLPPARARASSVDYLADAAATLARMQATPEPGREPEPPIAEP